MKAQVQPITLILISGILITLVGAAYIWGVPVIQKRTTLADFTATTNFMLALNDKILDIANSGGGRHSVDIPKGFARVIPYDAADPNNNSIILEVIIDQPMLVLDQEIPIKTSSLQEVGTFGRNEPRILTVKEDRFTTQYKLTFKLHYIELDTTGGQPKGFKIALTSQDTSAGSEKATASFNKNIVQPGQAGNRGDLALTLIDVDVV